MSLSRYRTTSGIEVGIGRVSRRALDTLAMEYPEPQPPLREMPIWGGVTDKVPDFDDPGYQLRRAHWYLRLLEAQLQVFAEGIEVALGDCVQCQAYQELASLDLVRPQNRADCIRYVILAEPADQQAITEQLLYNSTTTERAIQGWLAAFAVTYHEQPIMQFSTGQSQAWWSRLYEDREAARFAGIPWETFVDLSGPEQSGYVAHFRAQRTLEYLLGREKHGH